MNYQTYINSPEWKEKASRLKTGGVCLVCKSNTNLHVHHLSYENLGHETSNDLVVLCAIHHRKAHFSNTGRFINDSRVNYLRVKKMWRHHVKMERITALRKLTKRSGSNQREDLIN